MSDLVDSLSTVFDTVVAPAGDASTVSSAADGAGGFTDAGTALDAANAASTGAADTVDPSALADAGAPLDTANAAQAADTPDPGANTDSGIAPGEQVQTPPSQNLGPGGGLDPETQGGAGGMPSSEDGMGLPSPTSSTTSSDLEKWLKGNPGEAGIIGKLMAGGATGAMTALAMHNKIEAAREAEERHRQDVIRRGQVPLAAPGTFTPKRGIIDTARGV